MDHDGTPRLSGQALGKLNNALLDIASERMTGPVLQRLVDAARRLASARYAALGIPDGAGGFAQFLTAGMTDAQIEAIGPLPRVHGMLGAMLSETRPYRTADITRDPRFRYWPAEHPEMRSFLGVPVVADGQVIAAFYLTDKAEGAGFGGEDEALISALADHAAVAIENARLWERAREATMLEERERLARELHDAMSQALFSLQLTAATAADAVAADPAAAREHIETVRHLARTVQSELRALLVDLRSPDLEVDGLATVLRKQARIITRAQRVPIAADVDDVVDLDARVEGDLLRIAQEALHNALRHGDADHVTLRLRRLDGQLMLEVVDDGVGFDPADPAIARTRLGLASMRHRARALGGRLAIRSAPGEGTSVRITIDHHG